MARTDTLEHFLTDVADSIRTKKGTSGTISAPTFDTEIASISGGGSSDINEIEELVNMGKSRTNAYTFTWGTMPNAQIVLCVDDTLPAVTSLCVTNALAKNVPLSFGAISSNFNLMCTKGDTTKTVLQEIKRAIANGGEVFLHGNGTINASNIDDEDFLRQKFLTEKLVFESNGLYPRGAIVIGGVNEIYNDSRTDRWVRALFDFSDGWGIGEPYSHRRLAPTTLDAAKTYIDNAVANKSFIVIFAHKWYDFWNDMIDYAKGLGAEFTTWSNVVDRYGVKTFNAYTPTLTSISATKTTTTYNVGDTVSYSDVTVTATYSDGTTSNVTSSATIGTIDTSTSGSKSLSISYTENGVTKTTTIAITVADASTPPTPSETYADTEWIPSTVTSGTFAWGANKTVSSEDGTVSESSTMSVTPWIWLPNGKTLTINISDYNSTISGAYFTSAHAYKTSISMVRHTENCTLWNSKGKDYFCKFAFESSSLADTTCTFTVS